MGIRDAERTLKAKLESSIAPQNEQMGLSNLTLRLIVYVQMNKGAKSISSLVYSFSWVPTSRLIHSNGHESHGIPFSVKKEDPMTDKTTHNFFYLVCTLEHPSLMESPLSLAESSSNSFLFSFFLCLYYFLSLTRVTYIN